MLRSLVGSEMCIRDSINAEYGGRWSLGMVSARVLVMAMIAAIAVALGLGLGLLRHYGRHTGVAPLLPVASDPSCRLGEFDSGTWLDSKRAIMAAKEAGPPYNCSPSQVPEPSPWHWVEEEGRPSCEQDLLWGRGEWHGLGLAAPAWRPRGNCSWTQFDKDPNQVCQVATRSGIREIRFMGDSIVRALFWTFAGMVLDTVPGNEHCHWKSTVGTVSYTHLRAHETPEHLVCRLLLEKKKKTKIIT
eukprot:TRINITY_DN19410_c0_g1_i4.p1 TRINITY_DN19410_c0_g1~~TRINITY_DN19410_c0_g1_i4.p1  ORF type:complete len:245 (-),score=58.59 TRINITY_DN19410_c0_g1_i4:75-809(-)